jgi:putative hydrolase of the HAD superfamily
VVPSISSEIRAVVFDAVGTLIHPEPPVAVVYAEAGRRFGSRHDSTTIAAGFAAAFRRQDAIDYAAGLRTDEAREVVRWQTIVAEVLDDVADPEGCFRHLYEYFGAPAAWRTEPDAASTLAGLALRGYRLAIASNFDHRLRAVLEPGELRELPLIISASVGWRKPAPAFFAEACRAVAAESREVLYVGDDSRNDAEGARAAGLSAILFDPQRRTPSDVASITSLGDLLRSRSYPG